jgi:hypothetical protein
MVANSGRNSVKAQTQVFVLLRDVILHFSLDVVVATLKLCQDSNAIVLLLNPVFRVRKWSSATVRVPKFV